MSASRPAAFTVLCIDDNVMLIDALERRLNLEPGFAGLYRADSFAHAADDVEQAEPNVVLLDLDLPGSVSALDILADITERVPASKVIVLTGYPHGELVAETLGRGAWGFVSKGVSSERVIDAIQRVLKGEAVIALEDSES